ncbi:Bifunctional arginine demethylase and lysyl-hydroxylase JMJD6 [Tetrabaena socialis]|uniref:Bifunctional arginine demethylase and lysyl-hydroxylase JMJD6 n=1 Tax=Tetrabaena socialis TaxID=47790 RepID=A0A2J8AJA3_9CHLO|nr:Bifunctional arginine demethylase and lysyl-hydroxylase JMJD6 [Tetrabaena socialis]|eukprot:PNH12602.1 Bifunctional arginine demethylase and lysyl-hydroxylase JMJD6 [Tetrabaena socialis]
MALGVCDLTPQQFVERYERPRIPVVITGLADEWPAGREWTPERLAQVYGSHKFKPRPAWPRQGLAVRRAVGSDDDGYAVRLRLDWFLRYAAAGHHGGRDDSPLYVFDGTFADREGSSGMRRDYEVPIYFREDLFNHVGERRRPPYRWLVMGPARSGSGLHIDPLATSAWNTLLAGHKRWALFPPGTPRCHVLPREQGIEREAVSWFSKRHGGAHGERERWAARSEEPEPQQG